MPKQNHERLLLDALESGNAHRAFEILQKTAQDIDLDCRNEFGDTPLIIAARNGHDQLVRLLLGQGVDIESTNRYGDNALIAASACPGNRYVLELLLNAGVSIDHKNVSGRTALIEAASIGDLPNVTALLKHHPALDEASKEEETALSFAIVNEYADVVKSLIEAGAEVNWEDTKGWTPLIYAVYTGNVEIVRLLLRADSSSDHVDTDGNTILIHAVRSGNVSVVHEILKEAVKVNHRNNDGMNALDYAKECGAEEISRLLREASTRERAQGRES